VRKRGPKAAEFREQFGNDRQDVRAMRLAVADCAGRGIEVERRSAQALELVAAEAEVERAEVVRASVAAARVGDVEQRIDLVVGERATDVAPVTLLVLSRADDDRKGTPPMSISPVLPRPARSWRIGFAPSSTRCW
jgi:hypothetical protein